jgi:hypothetical protein
MYSQAHSAPVLESRTFRPVGAKSLQALTRLDERPIPFAPATMGCQRETSRACPGAGRGRGAGRSPCTTTKPAECERFLAHRRQARVRRLPLRRYHPGRGRRPAALRDGEGRSRRARPPVVFPSRSRSRSRIRSRSRDGCIEWPIGRGARRAGERSRRQCRSMRRQILGLYDLSLHL